MAIPSINELRALTVQALENLGGSARNQETFDEVARLGGVTKDDQNQTSQSGSVFYNRLAAAKTHLQNDRKIKNIGHGEWALASAAAPVRPRQRRRAKSSGPHGAENPAAVSADLGNDAAVAVRRVQKGLAALRAGLAPYVAKKMQKHYGDDWRLSASRTSGDEAEGELNVPGLLITILDNPGGVFQAFNYGGRLHKAHTFVHSALHARNAAAHFQGDVRGLKGDMPGLEALRHLDAVHELLAAVGAGKQAEIVGRLHEEQQRANLK